MKYYTFDELSDVVMSVSEKLDSDDYMPEGMYRVYVKAFNKYLSIINSVSDIAMAVSDNDELYIEAPELFCRNHKWYFK